MDGNRELITGHIGADACQSSGRLQAINAHYNNSLLQAALRGFHYLNLVDKNRRAGSRGHV